MLVCNKISILVIVLKCMGDIWCVVKKRNVEGGSKVDKEKMVRNMGAEQRVFFAFLPEAKKWLR